MSARQQSGDPYAALQRGFDLARRGGHMAQAEAAYGEAIAGGVTEAWLYLGVLLSMRFGHEREEEAALRAAMASDDVETASWAAARLGELLDFAYNDRSAARACFEFAEKHGTPLNAFHATRRLAELLAYDGDIQAARDRIRSFGIWFGSERNQDLSGGGTEPLALLITCVVGGRYTREAWRRFRRARFRVSRRRQSLVARSERLSAWSKQANETRSRLAERFWAEDDD